MILHVRCKTHGTTRPPVPTRSSSFLFLSVTSPTRTPLRLISWPPPPPAGRDESTDGPTGHLHAARFCELLAPRPRNRSPDDTPNAEFISARPHGTTKSCLIYYEESNARRPAPSHDRMSCELAMSWTAACRRGVVLAAACPVILQ